jgi:aspartate aminotransferase-like enzyme
MAEATIVSSIDEDEIERKSTLSFDLEEYKGYWSNSGSYNLTPINRPPPR